MTDAETIERNAVAIGTLGLGGALIEPPAPAGLVVVVRGPGSHGMARDAPVEARLSETGFATLCLDLLSEPEAVRRESVFDIALLRDRLVAAIRWARSRPSLQDLPLGLFATGTGVAAALAAAAGEPVQAVVGRSGRPDLARAVLGRVTADTLLIVGEADPEGCRLNRDAALDLRCRHRVAIVPRAGPLFDEPGSPRAAARLAADWFAATFRRTDR